MAKNYIGSTGIKKAFNLLFGILTNPIRIVSKDYMINPTSNNCIMKLDYDLSDALLNGYQFSSFIDPCVLYTDSHRYQQVTFDGLYNYSGTGYIYCLNNVPFKIRIRALIVKKSLYI